MSAGISRAAVAAAATLAVAAGLFACAGLPARSPPTVLSTEAPLTGLDLGGGGSWPAKDWWRKYDDAVLDALIDAGLRSSPTLATAHARFDSARQSVRIAGAAAGARLDASGDTSRQRLSDNGLFPPQLLGFNWYDQSNLGLQASYTFDWWGKQQASVAAAMDDAHAAQADRTAAALLLASSIADTYFGWQADQLRVSLARQREQIVEQEGAVAAARVRADLEMPDEVQRSAGALAAVREQIAQLEGSATLRIVALAALVGRAPAELPAFVARPLPALSAGVPDDVRIDLIARRADITASRWRVEAAERSLESARAEFLPDVSVNGLIGLQSIEIGDLLRYGSRVPAVTAAIHLPIFDAGRLKGRYGAARAGIDSAVASYNDAIVGATREVAMQATSRSQVLLQRTQRVIELAAAERLEASAAARVRQGVVDSRTALSATEASLEQRDALAQLDAAALSADIGLQRALGGGYDTTQDTTSHRTSMTTPP